MRARLELNHYWLFELVPDASPSVEWICCKATIWLVWFRRCVPYGGIRRLSAILHIGRRDLGRSALVLDKLPGYPLDYRNRRANAIPNVRLGGKIVVYIELERSNGDNVFKE